MLVRILGVISCLRRVLNRTANRTTGGSLAYVRSDAYAFQNLYVFNFGRGIKDPSRVHFGEWQEWPDETLGRIADAPHV